MPHYHTCMFMHATLAFIPLITSLLTSIPNSGRLMHPRPTWPPFALSIYTLLTEEMAVV